jgi:hypothetical protein
MLGPAIGDERGRMCGERSTWHLVDRPRETRAGRCLARARIAAGSHRCSSSTSTPLRSTARRSWSP